MRERVHVSDKFKIYAHFSGFEERFHNIVSLFHQLLRRQKSCFNELFDIQGKIIFFELQKLEVQSRKIVEARSPKTSNVCADFEFAVKNAKASYYLVIVWGKKP